MAAFAEKQQRRDEQQAAGKKPKGRAPQPPREGPRSKDQYNFTDPESRIMKSGAGFEQSYNAQAAVEIESRLLVSHAVTDAPNDKEQLEPTLAATSPVIESIAAVLVDSGFYSAAAVSAVESGRDGRPGPAVYAATGRQPHGRRIEALEKRADPPAPEPGASAAAVMAHRLSTKAGRELYALRKQTIEPVFGIIPSAGSGPCGKAALGFDRFSLRGLGHMRSEWTLVTLAYNLKRLYHLGARLQPA